jgi:hypothetical protein
MSTVAPTTEVMPSTATGPAPADTDVGQALALRTDSPAWDPSFDALISVVTNRLHSEVSRRGYSSALRQFLGWHRAQGAGLLSRALCPALSRHARGKGARAVTHQPASKRHRRRG